MIHLTILNIAINPIRFHSKLTLFITLSIIIKSLKSNVFCLSKSILKKSSRKKERRMN